MGGKREQTRELSLEQGRKEFFKQHPNLRIAGWDERDYKLWSQVEQLSSYGLLQNGDYMVSRNAIIALLNENAEKRFEDEHIVRR